MRSSSKAVITYGFKPILIITAALQFALVLTDGQQKCDVSELTPCGTNITKAVCEARGCCFNKTQYRTENCFRIASEYHSSHQPQTATRDKGSSFGDENGDKFPDDSIQIPAEIERLMEQIGNLSMNETMEVVNRLEAYLKKKASEGSGDVNWDYEVKGVFSAFIKVTQDSVFQPIKFSSGTEILIDQHSGTLGNGTERKITRAILVEYPTLMKVFVNHQKTKSKECRDEEIYMDDTPVISITAFDKDWNKVSVPVNYTVSGVNMTKPNLVEDVDIKPECKYLDEHQLRWFSAGCKVAASQNEVMKCLCNHTTKFSLMFVVYPLTIDIPQEHVHNIQIFEYVMESLSLVCLAATFGVLVLVQRRRSKESSVLNSRTGERTVVHMNFVAALACLHLVRLFSEISVPVEGLCATIVVCSHYFMLASGMWMLIEGSVLYLTVMRSMKTTRLGIHKYWIGWGTPVVIVLVAAAIGFTSETYIDEHTDVCQYQGGTNVMMRPIAVRYLSCWLSIESNMIWSAAGPLICIFGINILILSHTVIFVWRLNRRTDSMMPSDYRKDKQYFWRTAKSVLVLFPILGVPWLIGFLVNIDHLILNLVFQYLHVTLNGLQGFFVFVLYCIINKESRGIVTRVASNHLEQRRVSVTASNTLGRSISGGSRRERMFRGRVRSCSSQLGLSEQAQMGTPAYNRRASNVRSIGSAASQYSVYTLPMNRRQSSGSGSTSVSGCAHRINSRVIPAGQAELLRHRPGYYVKAGSSASLPRLGKIEHYNVLTKAGSVSSLIVTHRRTASDTADSYICKACKDGPCIHAAGDVAGLEDLNRADSGEAVLLGYKRTSSLDSLRTTDNTRAIDSHTTTRWPKRMTAEEFKRFSAIPEEKRRSGINSFISGDSSEHLPNRLSIRSQLKTGDDIEMQEFSNIKISVDVVAEDVAMEEQSETAENIIKENLEENDYADKQHPVEATQDTLKKNDQEEVSETFVKVVVTDVDAQSNKNLLEETNTNEDETRPTDTDKLNDMERLRREELELHD